MYEVSFLNELKFFLVTCDENLKHQAFTFCYFSINTMIKENHIPCSSDKRTTNTSHFLYFCYQSCIVLLHICERFYINCSHLQAILILKDTIRFLFAHVRRVSQKLPAELKVVYALKEFE